MTREQQPSAVTDPGWEAELRAGAAQDLGDDGEPVHVGSVEPELAIVRLMLHARAPAELEAARQDAIWAELARQTAKPPWWRSRWVFWGAPALAAAAAVVLVVSVRIDAGPGRDDATAELLEQQFALLAPAARADVAKRVDGARQTLRGELIAAARGDGSAPAGGAP
jgi:hypothetical protein